MDVELLIPFAKESLIRVFETLLTMNQDASLKPCAEANGAHGFSHKSLHSSLYSLTSPMASPVAG